MIQQYQTFGSKFLDKIMSLGRQPFLAEQQIENACKDQQYDIHERCEFNQTGMNEIRLFDQNYRNLPDRSLPRRYRRSVQNYNPPKYPPKCPKSEPNEYPLNQLNPRLSKDKNTELEYQYEKFNESNLLDESASQISAELQCEACFEEESQNDSRKSGNNIYQNCDDKNISDKSQSIYHRVSEIRNYSQGTQHEIGYEQKVQILLLNSQQNQMNSQKSQMNSQYSQIKVNNSIIDQQKGNHQDPQKKIISENHSEVKVNLVHKRILSKETIHINNQMIGAISEAYDSKQNHQKNKTTKRNFIYQAQQPHPITDPHNHQLIRQQQFPNSSSSNQKISFHLTSFSLSVNNKLKQAYETFHALIVDKSRYALLMLKDNLIIIREIQETLHKAIRQNDDWAVSNAEELLNNVFSQGKIQQSVTINFSVRQITQELNKCMGGARVDEQFAKIQLETRLKNRLNFIRSWHQSKISLIEYQTRQQISRLNQIQGNSVLKHWQESMSRGQNVLEIIKSHSLNNHSNKVLSESILMSEERRRINIMDEFQSPFISVIENRSPDSLIVSELPQNSPIVPKIHSKDSAYSMAEGLMDLLEQPVRQKTRQFFLIDEISGTIKQNKICEGQDYKKNLTDMFQKQQQSKYFHYIEEQRDQLKDCNEEINDYLRRIVGVVKEIVNITQNNPIEDQQDVDKLDEVAQIVSQVISVATQFSHPPKVNDYQNSPIHMLCADKQHQNSNHQDISPLRFIQTSHQQTQQKYKQKKFKEKAFQVSFAFILTDQQVQTTAPLVEHQFVQLPVKKINLKIENTCCQNICSNSVRKKTKLDFNPKIISFQVKLDESKRKSRQKWLIKSKQPNLLIEPYREPQTLSTKIHPGVFSITIEPEKCQPICQRNSKRKRKQEKQKRIQRIESQRIEQLRSVREDSEDLSRQFWGNIPLGSQLIAEWLPKMRSKRIMELNLIRYRCSVLIKYMVLCLKEYPLTIDQRFNDFRQKDKQMLKAFSNKHIEMPVEQIQLTEQLMSTVQSVIQRRNCERVLDFGDSS